MTRRRGWLLGIGVAVGALVLIAVGIGIWQSSIRPATAEDTATAYLHALESGSADDVSSAGVDVSPEALTAFASASAFIEDASVLEVDEQGMTATVEVTFRLDGDDNRATLDLTRDDDVWRVGTSALGQMQVTSTVGAFVAVGEAVFAVEDRIALLPATYDVVAAPQEFLDGTAAVRVLPGESAVVELEPSVRPEASIAAQAALDDHLEQCTSAGGVQPAGCGIRIPWGVEFREVSDVAYRVETLPTIALRFPMFTAGDGVLVATVTGTGQDGSARTETYRTERWSVRGDVSFTEKGVAVTVW